MLLPSLLLSLLPGTAELPKALELLRAGRDAEALQLLEGLDDSAETQFWTLRARAGIGQVTEVLEAADGDELAPADAEYLRGIAFHRQALDAIAQGKGGMVEFQFQDAALRLASATELDPERYSDAHLPLAEAYWNTQQLPLARKAGEEAVKRTAANPRAHQILGEVCFSQFITARADEAQAEAASAHWTSADAAFRGVLKVMNEKVAGHESMGAKAASKLGDLAVWKEKHDKAVKEYAVAVGLDPTQLNLAQVFDSLGGARFIACLKQGCAAFEKRYGAREASESIPLWWLGYAQFSEKEYADADETFERVLKLFPGYTNSWWYRAEARFQLSDMDGCMEFMRELGAHGMETLAAQVNTDPQHNLFILGGAIKRLNDSERYIDAAYLCDARAAASPNNWEFLDNVAYFYREGACKLMGGPRRIMWKKSKNKLAEATGYFERSLVAYDRAYELDPKKPHLLNDHGVILDYYLNRDLDEAESLYARAVEQAKSLLNGSEKLSDQERSLAETAQRDGANNLRQLKRRRERERKGERKGKK